MRHGVKRNNASDKNPLETVARNLAGKLNSAPEDFRHVSIHQLTDDGMWSVETRWEQRIEGEWKEVHWTEYQF